ncbi:MAG: hypothetical protein ACUVT2_10010 [Thiobacillaceae bacterium]
MPSKFQPRIRKARFVVSPFTPEQMIEFGNALLADVNARLERGENVYDQPAKPLAEKYAKWKARKYPPAVRNLKATGRTRRGAKVISASENRAVIGFTDPVAEQRIVWNQRRERQWGASPRNLEHLRRVVAQTRPVRVREAA